MALQRVPSANEVEINSDRYSIKAGSLEFDDGFAETTVTATEGADIIISQDPTSRKGMIKFELHSTKENLDSTRKFQRGEIHSIRIFDTKTGFTRTMSQGVCLNDSSKTLGSDGSFALTFEGELLA